MRDFRQTLFGEGFRPPPSVVGAYTMPFLLCLPTRAAAQAGSDDGTLLAIGLGAMFVIGLMAFFYFLPTVIAMVRGHEFKWVIFAVNLATGWTLLGWAAAIVWAVWPREKSLVDPFVGNPTGLSRRNAGDSMGAYSYGKARGHHQERSLSARARVPLSGDHMDQLERLARLRDGGVLSEAEFAQHKARILGGS